MSFDQWGGETDSQVRDLFPKLTLPGQGRKELRAKEHFLRTTIINITYASASTYYNLIGRACGCLTPHDDGVDSWRALFRELKELQHV